MAKRRPEYKRQGSAALSLEELFSQESGDRDTGHGPLRIALVYPNSYAVGMSSLGFHQVRQGLRDIGIVRVERAFAEPEPTRTLETNARLTEFHVLAFSVAFELDYLNILRILEANGIPLFAAERQPPHPLVLVGGVALSVNRHPIYPFADILAHGECEDLVEPLARGLANHIGDRATALETLQALPGIEITAGAWRGIGKNESIPKSVPADLDARIRESDITPDEMLAPPAPALALDPMKSAEPSLIVTPHAGLGRRVLVEIARGCTHRCTFCWVGHNCRRFLVQSADRVLELCDEAAEVTGCESVGLISAAVAAHPEIDAICEGLLSRGRSISFSSLRAEEIGPSILDALVRSGQRGLTLAPETGSPRLRRLLGKDLSDEQILEAVELAQQAGLADLKLYFMIGLPTETEEDADLIVSFSDRVRLIMHGHGRRRGHLSELSVNMGIYIPKPNTPLLRLDTPDYLVVKRREERVRRALGALPNVRVAPVSADLAAAQYLLSNRGFDGASLLYRVWKAGGNWRSCIRPMMRK